MKPSATYEASQSLGINFEKLSAMRKNKEVSIKSYADGGFKIVAKTPEAQALITRCHVKTMVDREKLN